VCDDSHAASGAAQQEIEMPGTLTFPIDDTLKAIVEHAAANDAGTFYGETIERSVFLVKDQGTYLMSGGKPGQPDPSHSGEGTKLLVLYANEINPTTMEFDDWYDRQHSICGGDDFVEHFSPKFFQDAIARGATKLTIKLSDDSIEMEAK
jgi:hypothetical protein